MKFYTKKALYLVILFTTILACTDHKSEDKSEKMNIESDTCKIIDDYLTKLTNEKNFSGGLLIIKDGKQIFNKGYGWANKDKKIPFTTTTLASIGSITKAFTATAIMKLVEQNKISLQDHLVKYFPFAPADKANITIHQLLTHSSGFHEFLMDDKGDYENIATQDFLNRAFQEPLAFKPGTKAIYTNVGYSILGIIIEQVSGQEYETYLKKNLFETIGINNIGYHFPAQTIDTIAIGYQNGLTWGTHQQRFNEAGGGPFWNLKANGGLEVSLNEMYLWLNSFTNHTILNEASIQKMFERHVIEDGTKDHYYFGYGCNISDSKRNTKLIDNGGSNGVYFARIIRLPQEKVVFYMVTNESTMNTNMVLPNITQLYFEGKIENDALTHQRKFEYEMSNKIYDMLLKDTNIDLEKELIKENIEVKDDMILLEVGQILMQENRLQPALVLYNYYNKKFPNIIVAWNDKGDVLRALNKNKDAIKCYQQALKIRPSNQRAKESLNKMSK